MVDFRGNIEGWIKHSEPDYYTFFIKAWIPFNAWYVKEMPQHNKNDKALIRELQDNPNSKPKQRIISLLKENDIESRNFKSHLAQLHINLEKRRFIHNEKILSLTSLALVQNPIKYKGDHDSNGNSYKAERTTTHFEALVVNSIGKSLIHFKSVTYSLTELQQNIHFIGLDNKVKNKLTECFKSIDPNKVTNIISTSKNKAEYILIDKELNVKLIKDYNIISVACIKILYSLRCMLFHGEIDPTISNSKVYEHAYYILKYIITELN